MTPRIDTDFYFWTHGKKPRGTGQWWFSFSDSSGVYPNRKAPGSMTYSQAVKWAKQEAKKLVGIHTITVRP